MEPTPPKNAEKLRAALEAIHAQAPSAAAPGPLTEGLKPDDQLIIASFYDREVRKRYQELLIAHSIGSSIERRDGRDQVLIDTSDREQAARLLDEHLLAYPDKVQARGRRVIDFMLLAGVLGATFSTIFVVDRSLAKTQARWGIVVLTILAFTLYGAIVGGLLGTLKERFAKNHPPAVHHSRPVTTVSARGPGGASLALVNRRFQHAAPHVLAQIARWRGNYLHPLERL